MHKAAKCQALHVAAELIALGGADVIAQRPPDGSPFFLCLLLLLKLRQTDAAFVVALQCLGIGAAAGEQISQCGAALTDLLVKAVAGDLRRRSMNGKLCLSLRQEGRQFTRALFKPVTFGRQARSFCFIQRRRVPFTLIAKAEFLEPFGKSRFARAHFCLANGTGLFYLVPFRLRACRGDFRGRLRFAGTGSTFFGARLLLLERFALRCRIFRAEQFRTLGALSRAHLALRVRFAARKVIGSTRSIARSTLRVQFRTETDLRLTCPAQGRIGS